MGIATSHSHTEMLQDMVLNLSEGAGRRDTDHDKTVLKDLVKEMVAFRYYRVSILNHVLCMLIWTMCSQCHALRTATGSVFSIMKLFVL